MTDQQTPWDETAEVQLSGPLKASSVVLSTNTEPCTDRDRQRFATALGPCLALTAPSGMGQEERRAWMEAAFATLRHLPIDAIEKAATEARKRADHPSKIVPVIVEAAEADMAWRKRMSSGRPSPESMLPAPGNHRPDANEIDAICKQFAVGRYASNREATSTPHAPTEIARTADPDRPCRAPSREDYIRLFGIDPEAPKPQDQAAA